MNLTHGENKKNISNKLFIKMKFCINKSEEKQGIKVFKQTMFWQQLFSKEKNWKNNLL